MSKTITGGRRVARVIACVIIFGGVFFLNGTWGPLAKRPPPGLEWSRVHSEEGRYEIDMPGTPTLRRETHCLLFLFKFDVIGHELARNDLPAHFSVHGVDVPAWMQSQAVLEEIGQCLCAQKKGMMLNAKEVTLDGHPGREIQFEFKDRDHPFISSCRMYLVRRRLYLAAVVTPRRWASSGHVWRFLDSFQPLAADDLP